MTSKQRAMLRAMANEYQPIIYIGKEGVTEALLQDADAALEARELIKIHILKNCADDGKELAAMLAERTHSQVVQVIGKMIVLYKPAKEEKDRKIVLPQ